MKEAIREGYTIRVKLPEACGHTGYSVKCTYKYIKGKYLLSMWLTRDDISDSFRIDSQEIDTQYVNGARGSIEDSIVRIVRQAYMGGHLSRYVERFEYTCRCFDLGNEMLERERMAKNNGGAV